VAEPVPGPGDVKGPNSYAPKPRFDYHAPSFLWVHRYLLIAFALALIVATVLLFRTPHRQYRGLTIHAPSPSEPIWVEPIPERPASSAQ
jgi:hypothetical protein